MENTNLVRTTNGLYPAPQKNAYTKQWSKQGNVVSAGSNNPIIVQAKAAADYVIEVAAPDMERNDFNINLKEHSLTVSVCQNGKQNSDNTENNNGNTGNAPTTYEREFKLPEVFDTQKTSIGYDAGVLQIVVPRRT